MHLTSPPLLLHALLLLLLHNPTSTLATKPNPNSKPKPPPSPDAILLSTVSTLTLRAGQPTTHRRVPAIPQLRCVPPRSPLCQRHARAVGVVRCASAGAGYGGSEDVQWTCSAPLPPELRLGATDVVCEGYAGPGDPYVLRGSCGVEYTLALTELGEERFPELTGEEVKNKNGGGGGLFWEGGKVSYDGEEESADWSAWIFGVVFVGVALWILVSACSAAGSNNNNDGRNARRPPPRRPRAGGDDGFGGGGFWPGGGGGGGGGGDGSGGGGWDDPPPPYPGTKPSSSYPSAPQAAAAGGAGGGWRPGFWSGLAGGAAAAYAAGNMGNRNRNRDRDRDRRNEYSRLRNDYGGGSSSSSIWGSSSRSGAGSGSGSGAGRSGSTSSERYESTGFGSTSRR